METLNTPTLDPEKLPTPEKSLNGYRVAVCDIDYTLVDFGPAHKAGISAIAQQTNSEFAELVSDFFDLTLVGHRLKSDQDWEHRGTFEVLSQHTKKLHQNFAKEHGQRVWSRETWIIIAAEKLGVKLDRTRVTKLRDAYWGALTDHSNLYPDAQDFLQKTKDRGIALVLMTGSDSVLKINDDLSLDYDPKFSEQYKRERIEKLDLDAAAIVIGDPIDKPDTRYFDKLFGEIEQLIPVGKEELIVVGDSQRNDLDVPAERGYPTLLIERK